MIIDPTEDIKRIRRALAAKFDNDVARIGEDIRLQQRLSGRVYITLPKRHPHLAQPAESSERAAVGK